MTGRPWPAWFEDLCLDLFVAVRFWRPSPGGVERGRAFERLWQELCARRRVRLSERAGARTLATGRAASGLMHESDAVVAGAEITLHVELKHLTTEVNKNDLLVFNQKGIDFLLGAGGAVRGRPFLRMFGSGTALSEGARRFAALWGIVVVEPDRLPIPLIYRLAREGGPWPDPTICPKARVRESVQGVSWALQQRLRECTAELADGRSGSPARRAVQRVVDEVAGRAGDAVWAAMDQHDPRWLEDHFDELACSAPVVCELDERSRTSRSSGAFATSGRLL